MDTKNKDIKELLALILAMSKAFNTSNPKEYNEFIKKVRR